MLKQTLFLFAAVLVTTSPLQAQPVNSINVKNVVVCDGPSTGNLMPTFTEPGCRESRVHLISPHNRLIWLKASVNVPEEMMTSDTPLGLFVSGKAASAFYWNGQLVGQNGVPASTPEDETPGRMDVVLFLPKRLLNEGPNELVVQMSGHHGYIKLANPLHLLMIGPFVDPTSVILRRQLPSFVPLGVLIVGALYFGTLAIRRREDRELMLVPLAAFFAAGQLIAEASRGVLPYTYPYHDIRLIFILLFAVASGACLLLHVVNRFLDKQRVPVALAALGLVMIPVFATRGFDGKTVFGILAPAIIGGAIAAYAAVKRRPGALAYVAALTLFSLALFLMPYQFMDILYYYVVAGLLLFLFGQQIQIHMQEKRLRGAEQAKSYRLQLILDETREKLSPGNIKVSQPGKVDLIPTDQVCYCKGARDYVELVIAGVGSILHNTSLVELEKQLPATFLRVHRSYIVNTVFIQSLEREASGSGNLILSTGDKVPVSRRIMPKVRKALE